MIKPTIGRVVWFYPSDFTEGGQPQAALIAFVHSDNCINLAAHDVNGNGYGATSVPLVQDGELVPENGYYAKWMPYQVGQAKKNEAQDIGSGITGHDISDAHRDSFAAGQQAQQAQQAGE